MFASKIAHRLLPSLARRSSNNHTIATTATRSISTNNNYYNTSSCLLGRGILGGVGSTTPKNTLFPRVSSTYLPTTNSSITAAENNGLSSSILYHHQQQTRGFASKKHKWVIRQSKGFKGRANRCFRVAIRRLEKSWQYAYRDRKVKKREFRKLWIQRLNAGVRQYGVSYSNFINMQGKSGVVLDRKILSGLAMYEPFSFKAVVDVVKKVSAENASAGK